MSTFTRNMSQLSDTESEFGESVSRWYATGDLESAIAALTPYGPNMLDEFESIARSKLSMPVYADCPDTADVLRWYIEDCSAARMTFYPPIRLTDDNHGA
jgi:hypothetical protein